MTVPVPNAENAALVENSHVFYIKILNWTQGFQNARKSNIGFKFSDCGAGSVKLFTAVKLDCLTFHFE